MIQCLCVLYYQGFRKIDFEHWEYANEKFIKDQKHLMKNNHPLDPEELIEKLNNHQTRTNLLLENFQQRLDAILIRNHAKIFVELI
jgi:hypothetical protein